MNNSRTFDDVWEELKTSGEEEKKFFAAAEETARIINELTEERIRSGISQRQLAEKTGLKQSAIARMESLQRTPRLDTLIRVANALDIKLEITKESANLPKIIDFTALNTDMYVYNLFTSSAILSIS